MRARLLSKISVITLSAAALYGISSLSPANLAQAASFDFDFNGPACAAVGACSDTDDPDGNTRTFTTAPVTVKARAFSFTSNHASGGSNNAAANAWLGMYLEGAPEGGSDANCCGLGVTNSDSYDSSSPGTSGDGSGPSPQHGLDNIGRLDFIAFLFDKTVKLNSVEVNVYSGDSDLQLWVGNISDQDGDADIDEVDVGMLLTGKSLAELDALFAASQPIDMPGNGTSGARATGNNVFGNFAILAANTVSDFDDAVKIAGLAGETSNGGDKVPEPMTGLLFAGGVAGLAWARRRAARKAQR
jgi:hypothetical protein